MTKNENAVRAVSLLLARGTIAMPQAGSKWICLNAQRLAHEASELIAHLTCEQGFRSTFNQLQASGYDVKPALDNVAGLDGALVFAGRSRRQNEHWIARAWNSAREGSAILIAGEKTVGIASLRKWITQFAEIEASHSKYHAVVFSVRRGPMKLPYQTNATSFEGFLTAPGMFSSDGPDEGSALLADHFDERISGTVADFGCGWGYLGRRLLAANEAIDCLDCYDADWPSLQAAKQNLDAVRRQTRLEFHWIDLTKERIERRFDWVIMNPPFHAGRAAEPAIGAAIIQTAAAALKPGGRLLMVANRNLPYEAVLKQFFRSAKQIAEDRGFKILEAVR